MHMRTVFLLLSLPAACMAWSFPNALNIPTLASPACRLRGGAAGTVMGVEVNRAQVVLCEDSSVLSFMGFSNLTNNEL
jgi:hypothetical protein